MPFFRIKRLVLVIVACLFVVSCSFTFYFMPKSDELDLIALFEHRHEHGKLFKLTSQSKKVLKLKSLNSLKF